MKTSNKSAIKILSLIAVMAMLALVYSANVYAATSFSSSTQWDGNSWESETTSSSYDQARHETTQWQELDRGPYGSNESDDPKDFGISWKTGSGTWGNDDLYVSLGDTVSFQFKMHKDSKGTHYADYLKAWVDMGADGSYDDPTDKIFFQEEKLSDIGSQRVFTYEAQTTITQAHLDDGSLWLRARVSCSHSLLKEFYEDKGRSSSYSWDDQFAWNTERKNSDYWRGLWKSYEDMFSPTGYYYQGEVEEWKIGLLHRPGNVIPEPGTMVLFGFGLLGIAKIGRRKSQ